MSAPTRQEIEAQIAQFREPWAWETTSYNATVARDDALAKAALIVEAFPALASQAAQPAEADGWVMVPREPTQAMMDALARQAQKPTGWHNVYPAMYRALLAATPKAPATDAGETEDEEIAFKRDIARQVREYFSAPPAPNDDLRAALEATCDAEIAKYTGTYRSDDDIRYALNTMRTAVLAALKENRRG